MNLEACKTLGTLIALCIIYNTGYAQRSTISAADSIAFVELAKQFNNTINNEPARADSLAAVYFSKAQQIKNDDYMGRGAALTSTARLMLNKMKEGEEWYKRGQQYFEKSENYLWKGYGNLNLGLIYTRKYDFEKGLPYLTNSVEDFEKAKGYDMVASAYCSISNAYHDAKNYEKGKEYAQIALKIIGEHDTIKDYYRWSAYSVLAINYDDNKEYEKAIETHLKALPFAKERVNSTYNNLGNTYKKMGRTDSALSYFNKSLIELRRYSSAYDFKYSYATILGNMVDVYRLTKNYIAATTYLDSALYYAIRSESPEKILDAYEYAYLLKKETKEPETALAFLEKYQNIKDSLFNEEKTKAIINFQEKYEAEKRQNLIEQQKFEIAQKDQWLWFAGIGLLLLCVSGFFIYRANKSRQGRRLREEIFNRQEIEARALFEGEQNERIRIARDLHDGVGQMLSLVKMNLSMLDTNDNAVQKAMRLTDKTIDEVRDVSHNLIPEELNFGIFKALQNLTDKVNASGETKMEIEVAGEVQSLQFEKQNELSIYRIVQEVVSNMIKHAGASLLNLSVYPAGDHIIISVKDNGRGLNMEDIEKSKGIGWKNINARIHMLDGKINVLSEKLSGTQIEITLPANGAK